MQISTGTPQAVVSTTRLHADSAPKLRGRIAACSQKDVVLGMFLESSLTTVAKECGQARADEVRQKVARGKAYTSFFRYPHQDLLEIIDLGLQSAPDYGKGVEEFGRAAVRIFFDSPVGKTMLVLSATNPHRLLAAAPAGYKACVTFGERLYEKVGETAVQVRFHNDLLGPSWHVGVFEQALLSVCKLKVEVQIAESNPIATDFLLKVCW